MRSSDRRRKFNARSRIGRKKIVVDTCPKIEIDSAVKVKSKEDEKEEVAEASPGKCGSERSRRSVGGEGAAVEDFKRCLRQDTSRLCRSTCTVKLWRRRSPGYEYLGHTAVLSTFQPVLRNSAKFPRCSKKSNDYRCPKELPLLMRETREYDKNNRGIVIHHRVITIHHRAVAFHER